MRKQIDIILTDRVIFKTNNRHIAYSARFIVNKKLKFYKCSVFIFVSPELRCKRSTSSTDKYFNFSNPRFIASAYEYKKTAPNMRNVVIIIYFAASDGDYLQSTAITRLHNKKSRSSAETLLFLANSFRTFQKVGSMEQKTKNVSLYFPRSRFSSCTTMRIFVHNLNDISINL